MAIIKATSGMINPIPFTADSTQALQVDLHQLVKTSPEQDLPLLEDLKETTQSLDAQMNQIRGQVDFIEQNVAKLSKS